MIWKYQFRSVISLTVLFLQLITSKNVFRTLDSQCQDQDIISAELSATDYDYSHCVKTDCTYLCFHGNADNLVQDINQITIKRKCPEIHLKICNYTFTAATLTKNFLENISMQFRVRSLSISSSNIATIEDEAFNAFEYLKELSFENLRLSTIQKMHLYGLQNLEKFAITQLNHQIDYLGYNLLEAFKHSLQDLKIRVGMKSSKNITDSCSLLSRLTQVDFSFNDFQGNIKASDYSRLSLVEYLDLSNSKITYLPDEMFTRLLNTLRYVDLSNNQLKTFSVEIFGWKEILDVFQMRLDWNPWECTCDLETNLRKKLSHIINADDLKCSSPMLLYGISVLEAELCASLPKKPAMTVRNEEVPKKNCSQNSDIQNDRTDLATTSNPFRKTDCRHKQPAISFKFEPDKSRKMNVHCQFAQNKKKMISVETKQKNFWIKRMTDSSVQINFDEEYLPEYSLIWFNKVDKDFHKMEINYKEYGLGCLRNITDMLIVDNLHPLSTYTFCLAAKNEKSIPPFNCVSHHVRRSDLVDAQCSEGAWIAEDMKTTGISLLVSGILLAVFMGSTLVYCCIKKKPSLLKGHSKRVVSPQKNAADIIVLPKGRRPSLFASSNDAIVDRFMLSQRRHTSPMRKWSLKSYDSTYVHPNLYEIISPRATRLNSHSMRTPKKKSIKRNSNDPLPAIPNSTDKGLSKSLPASIGGRLEASYLRDICDV